MPDFDFETPRYESGNKEIVNKGETHLPCVVLVDTSGSMSSVMGELHDGLQILGDSICEDALAKGRVEISVIAFDDDARVVMPFGSMYEYEVPRLTAGGLTAMHAAVDLGLEQLEIRCAEYKTSQTSYYRPWMFLLTDGHPNDDDNGAFRRLLEEQEAKHCIFYPVGIGNGVDMDLLKTLRTDHLVFHASREDFKGAFEWLSHSLSTTSNSNPGTTVYLPSPKDYQLTIES